ncbi:MAG TPA: ROK family protein [Streptosporangiaceae bacterium]|nr:ROK family protein [Streptosporangiaceae bacterium]
MAHVLGIDIGGTGIKAAPVDTATGQLTAMRQKVPTPQPATPAALAKIAAQLVQEFDWTGPVGITYPGVVVAGTVHTAANMDPSWIGVDAVKLFGSEMKMPVTVLNDADAAGLAEMRFGAGKGVSGTVLLLTLGTGIGSALFIDGMLVPNTEFGHIQIRGKDAEKRASEHAREEHDLSWGDWAGRVDEYLEQMEALLSPSLIIIGGGVSRKSDKFLPFLTQLRAKVVPAALHNDAGIVGAAMAADAAKNLTALRV